MNIATRKFDYASQNLGAVPPTYEPNANLVDSVPVHHQFERPSEFSQYDWNQPYIESLDIMGTGLAIAMTLGPLAAYVTGFGA